MRSAPSRSARRSASRRCTSRAGARTSPPSRSTPCATRRRRDYLDRAGLADRVDLRLKDASEGLAELEPGSFDLAFIDGPKYLYADHIDPVIALLRSGGLLLVDNVLISGAAATQEPIGHWDAERIQEMRAFNARLAEHPQLRTTITPVGDGVALAVRQ